MVFMHDYYWFKLTIGRFMNSKNITTNNKTIY